MIHAHWFVAAAQLVVGVVWSMVMWGTGLRKTPNLTASDIAACVPIGLFACLAHAGSVLAVSTYDVSDYCFLFPPSAIFDIYGILSTIYLLVIMLLCRWELVLSVSLRL